MNEQQASRIQKLMKINMKAENPPDLIARLAADSITLDTRITGKSDKEVIDTLISKDEQDYKSIGVMYHVLTSAGNAKLFTKMLKYINGGGVDYWHTVLCNMNMILFECWPFIHLTCKKQLLRLIREAVQRDVKQIENVLMNAYRVANLSADPAGKQKVLYKAKKTVFLELIKIIREHESWFKGQKECAALVGSILTCTTSAIASIPAPRTAQHTFREQLIDLVHFVIKSKKTDCQTLGRDFILILMRLDKLPQVEDIWKDIVTNPASYGVTGIEDFLSKPNVLQHLRLSKEMDKKLQFMVNNGGKNMLIYFSWFSNKYLRGADGPAARADCVRQLLYMVLDPSKPSCFENRIQIIHLLVTTAQPLPEQQWLKLCLFADWLGFDEKNLTNFNYIEVPFLVLRYALSLPPMSSHVNTIVQNSHGVQYANSLLEYLCKSVESFIPQLSAYVKKNVCNAMGLCRGRFPQTFPKVIHSGLFSSEVARLVNSVFGAMHLRIDSPPPLYSFPLVVIMTVMEQMHLFDAFKLTFTSKQTKRLLKAAKIKVRIRVKDDYQVCVFPQGSDSSFTSMNLILIERGENANGWVFSSSVAFLECVTRNEGEKILVNALTSTFALAKRDNIKTNTQLYKAFNFMDQTKETKQ